MAVIKVEKYNNQVEAVFASGVRQGWYISLTFFNLHKEGILKEVSEEIIGDVKVSGILLQMVRIADDKYDFQELRKRRR